MASGPATSVVLIAAQQSSPTSRRSSRRIGSTRARLTTSSGAPADSSISSWSFFLFPFASSCRGEIPVDPVLDRARELRHRADELFLVDAKHHLAEDRQGGTPPRLFLAERAVVVEADPHGDR